MKKLLLSAFFAAIGLTAAAEGSQIYLGDSKDDPFVYMGDGLAIEEDSNIGVAIRISSRQLQAYPGAKIIGLHVAAAQDAHELEIEAFLCNGLVKRDGSFQQGETLASTTDYITWDSYGPGGIYGKWSDVLFDEPWTIPSDPKEIRSDVFFGLYTFAEAKKQIIGTSWKTQSVNAKTAYVAVSDDLENKKPTNWLDITAIPYIYVNNVCVCAIVELPEENLNSALAFQAVFMPNVNIVNKPAKAYVFLANEGPTEIKSFEITTTYGDTQTPYSYTFEDSPMPIGYVSENRAPIEIKVPVMGTGKHTLTITKVNGEENYADPDGISHEFNLIALTTDQAEEHIRRPLVEQYLSEDNYLSGTYQDDVILPSLEPFKDRCVYLPHHANDKFGLNGVDVPALVGGEQSFITLTDGDRLFIGLHGDINKTYLPAQTIDRSIQMENILLSGKTDAPVGPTLYPMAIQKIMPGALSVPTFGTVYIDSKYDAETGLVDITASGSVADVLPEGEKAHLTIYLIEENIESDSQEFPEDASIEEKYPDGKFVHSRVIRQNVTDANGVEIEPGDFVKTFPGIEIDNPKCVIDHMKVIALLHRPNTNDCLQRDVINSTEEPMADTYEESGIASVAVERTEAGHIFDLQGRRLESPVRGINIINGKKILVK